MRADRLNLSFSYPDIGDVAYWSGGRDSAGSSLNPATMRTPIAAMIDGLLISPVFLHIAWTCC